MTVADLIEELKKMPQHHPVRAVDGEIGNIRHASTYNSGKTGPVVYIHIDYDPDEDDGAY